MAVEEADASSGWRQEVGLAFFSFFAYGVEGKTGVGGHDAEKKPRILPGEERNCELRELKAVPGDRGLNMLGMCLEDIYKMMGHTPLRLYCPPSVKSTSFPCSFTLQGLSRQRVGGEGVFLG